MRKSNEYIVRRSAIYEAALRDFGELLAVHFPELNPQLSMIGEAWDKALDKLDVDIPDIPESKPEEL